MARAADACDARGLGSRFAIKAKSCAADDHDARVGWHVAKHLQRQAQLMLLLRGLGGPMAVKAKTGAADARVARAGCQGLAKDTRS